MPKWIIKEHVQEMGEVEPFRWSALFLLSLKPSFINFIASFSWAKTIPVSVLLLTHHKTFASAGSILSCLLTSVEGLTLFEAILQHHIKTLGDDESLALGHDDLFNTYYKIGDAEYSLVHILRFLPHLDGIDEEPEKNKIRLLKDKCHLLCLNLLEKTAMGLSRENLWGVKPHNTRSVLHGLMTDNPELVAALLTLSDAELPDFSLLWNPDLDKSNPYDSVLVQMALNEKLSVCLIDLISTKPELIWRGSHFNMEWIASFDAALQEKGCAQQYQSLGGLLDSLRIAGAQGAPTPSAARDGLHSLFRPASRGVRAGVAPARTPTPTPTPTPVVSFEPSPGDPGALDLNGPR